MKNILATFPSRYCCKWSEKSQTEITSEIKAFLNVPKNIQESSGVHSSVCGHVFRKGEGNYRCRDCGLDDTCVMCSKCFHATDHSGHDVFFSVTSGGGGVCDCGDPEAWRVPLVCSIHSVLNISDSQSYANEQEILRLRGLIAVLLDYTLLVLARIDVVPETPLSITERSLLPTSDRIIEIYPDVQDFGAVLWNDEYHSFDQVIGTAVDALECDSVAAEEVAKKVDIEGRYLVSEGNIDKLPDLRKICRVFRSIGLGCNIRPLLDLFEENIVMCIVEVLVEYCANSDLFCNALATELLSCPIFENPPSFISAHLEEIQKKLEYYAKRAELPAADFPVSLMEGKIFRLDLFFLFDMNLWKKTRNDMKKLFASALTKDKTVKIAASLRFFYVYEELSTSFLRRDRETELNIIFFSVQIFTTPSVATYLVAQTNALQIITKILLEFFADPQRQTLKFNTLRSRKYTQFFRDLEYLWSSSLEMSIQNDEVMEEFVTTYLHLLDLFSEMDPNKREANVHIEYESESWSQAFNLTYILSGNIAKFVEWICSLDKKWPQRLFECILTRIGSGVSNLDYQDIEVPPMNNIVKILDYNIFSKQISFHHPLVWLFGALIREMKEISVNQPNGNVGTSESTRYLFDIAVRTCAVISQQRAGLWVRNGYSFVNQVFNYTRMTLRGETYDMDLAVLQYFSANTDQDLFLVTLLNRFGLNLPLLNGKNAFFDETHLALLLEEFYFLILFLLTDVVLIPNMSEERIIRKELIQALSSGPCSYSSIEKKIPHRLAESKSLNNILHEIAVLKMPNRMEDTGKYELKDEILPEVDLYFIHQTASQREETKHYLKTKNALIRKKFSLRPLARRFYNNDLFLLLLARGLQLKLNLPETQSVLSSEKVSHRMIEVILHILAAITDDEILCQRIGNFKFAYKDDLVSLPDILFNLHDKEDEFREMIVDLLGKFGKPLKKQEQITQEYSNPADDAFKRQESRDRQAKIMAQFMQQQIAFADAHANLYDEIDDELDELINEEIEIDYGSFMPTGTCIICQENLDKHSKEPFGLSSCLQISHLVKLESMEDIAKSLNCKAEYMESMISKRCSLLQRGFHFSSCGHLMHRNCQEHYNKLKREGRFQHTSDLGLNYVCPLCKSHANIIVPVNFVNNDFKSSCLQSSAINLEAWISSIAKLNKECAAYLQNEGHELSDSSLAIFFEDSYVFESQYPNYSKFMNDVRTISEHYEENILYPESEYFDAFGSKFLNIQSNNLRLVDKDKWNQLSTASYQMFSKMSDLFIDSNNASNFRDTIPLLDNSSSLWRLLAYTVRCIKISHENLQEATIPLNESQIITTLSSALICFSDPPAASPDNGEEAEKKMRTFIISKTFDLEDQESELTNCLGNDSFEYLLGFLSNGYMREQLNCTGSVEFFFLHAVTRYLVEIIRIGSIICKSHVVDTEKVDPKKSPLTTFSLQLIDYYYKPFALSGDAKNELGIYILRKKQTILGIGEERLKSLVGDVCSDLADCIDLLLRYSVPLLSSVWRSDRTAGMADRISALVQNSDTIKFFLKAASNAGFFSFKFAKIELDTLFDLHSKQILNCEKQELLVNTAVPELQIRSFSSPYKLADLPEKYQDLVEESLAFICPSCNSCPLNPALCLLCGTFMCASSYCCLVDGKGECSRHIEKCGLGVGIFLLIKKCSVLFLSGIQGSMIPAPYMDEHGETDIGLKRGKPQYLNIARYEELKRIWLKHEIPTAISRKRDSASDEGGWGMM